MPSARPHASWARTMPTASTCRHGSTASRSTGPAGRRAPPDSGTSHTRAPVHPRFWDSPHPGPPFNTAYGAAPRGMLDEPFGDTPEANMFGDDLETNWDGTF